MKKWMVISMRTTGQADSFVLSPIAQRYAGDPGAPMPVAGQAEPGMSDAWAEAAEDEKGQVMHALLSNGYALAEYVAEEACMAAVSGKGHYTFYINGDPFEGDIYGSGFGLQPVFFRKGQNRVLVRAVRGGFAMEFRPVPAGAALLDTDCTLPDLREGRDMDAWGSVLVANMSGIAMEGASIRAGGGQFETTVSDIGFVPPLCLRKAAFKIALRKPAAPGAESVPLALTLVQGSSERAIEVGLRLRKEGQSYKETFISQIDGSVQFYAVMPPPKPVEGKGALFLSLHGASVRAEGQADAYSPKAEGWIVAATNRRPYGFDWEDWGRLDALEVLAVVRKRYPVDENRVYLTGHSMGGHGTWHVAANHPGLFAAIGPSAGWISFMSYAKRPAPQGTGPDEFFLRGHGPSDTLSLKENLRDLGVFIIHGDADDNVPVSESRGMVKELGSFHKDFVYREFPAKGHWWDESKEPGTDCVDLADLFDFFSRRMRAGAPREIRFKTHNPAVSSVHRWIAVLGQEKLLCQSEAKAKAFPGLSRIEIGTSNVSRLSVDPSPFFENGDVKIAVDGIELDAKVSNGGILFLAKDGGTWRMLPSAPGSSEKNPIRYGPFKQAFARRFMLVYGTGGTSEENAAALRRARYDASSWWYRGNGSADVVPDSQFDPSIEPERNVVLYGHSGMNRAFAALLDQDAVEVRAGRMRIGEKVLKGEGVSCLFIRPRKGSVNAMVAVVGGTGAQGIDGTMAAPYFRSGVHYPDVTAWTGRPQENLPAGLKAAGIFGRDWKIESGEWWFSQNGWESGETANTEDEY